MSLTVKLVVFLFVVIGEVAGAMIIVRNFKKEGKDNLVPVILVGCIMSITVIGVVLFMFL